MKKEQEAFSVDFLWSASTSAYQFEGSFANDGKGLSVQDVKENRNPALAVASDHLHHLEEDVALLKALGLKGYRFSIAWSRVLPLGTGKVNEQGLAFYHQLIDLLEQAGIAPIVTLFHDDLPWELQKKGGWNNRETIAAFVAYCQVLFEHFGNQVAFWQPICEQNLITIERIAHQQGTLKEIMQANHHLFLAHAKAVQLHHQMGLSGKIGPALNLVEVYPISADPHDVLAAKTMALFRNWFYLDVLVKGEYPPQMIALLEKLAAMPTFLEEDAVILKEGVCDLIGFSTYTSVTVQASQTTDFYDQTGLKYGFNLPGLFEITVNPNLGKTEFDWEVDPLGARLILMEVEQRYHKPIFIIERSLGLDEKINAQGIVADEKRIRYLQLQIKELIEAIRAGVDIIGFCTWSAFDLVSTNNGYKKRYGLIYVDRDDEDCRQCQRVLKKSYRWYQRLIATQGKSWESEE